MRISDWRSDVCSSDLVDNGSPLQARAMDKTDIANLRRWHRNAALRAREAGFDIVYVYAGHDMTLPPHFLSPRHNDRRHEYGRSLDNSLRLIRELLTHTTVGVGKRRVLSLPRAFHAPPTARRERPLCPQ